MNKKKAENNAKSLVKNFEIQLKKFLQKNPVKKLETLQQEFIEGRNPLHLLIDDLINELKNYDSQNRSPDKWQNMDERIWTDIRDFLPLYFEKILFHTFIQSLLVFYNPNIEEYRKQLKHKYKLTPKIFRERLLENLDDLFIDDIKHGGKESELNDNEKLRLLALYNRFLIVIKNARRDIKILKKTELGLNVTRKIFSKYEIPESLIESTFSTNDAPGSVALDWVKKEMQLSYEESYIKEILPKARKEWRSICEILPGVYTPKRTQKQLVLIDIIFQEGWRYYAVDTKNRSEKDKLKYIVTEEFFVGGIY